MLRVVLSEFLRPLDHIPDDLQLAGTEKKLTSSPQLTTKEIKDIVQTELRAVYDLIRIGNEEVGNSSSAFDERLLGVQKTISSLGKIASRTEKKIEAISETQLSATNSRARSEELPVTRDANPRQVEAKLDQLRDAVDQLRLASNIRMTKTVAVTSFEQQSHSGKLIPVAALNEWLDALDEDPLRRLVNSLPRMFNICDSLFRMADSIEDGSGQGVVAELKKAQTLIVNWQESVGIHRVPAVGDCFDPDLARIVERFPTMAQVDHNRIKEVRKFGYVWIGAEEWQLQKGEVVVWNFSES